MVTWKFKDNKSFTKEVDPAEICWIEREDSKITIKTLDHSVSFSGNLTLFEAGGRYDLSDYREYFRVNKSVFVNVKFISNERIFTRIREIEVCNERLFRVSRTRKVELMERIEEIGGRYSDFGSII